jgi:hypothetical protein
MISDKVWVVVDILKLESGEVRALPHVQRTEAEADKFIAENLKWDPDAKFQKYGCYIYGGGEE